GHRRQPHAEVPRRRRRWVDQGARRPGRDELRRRRAAAAAGRRRRSRAVPSLDGPPLDGLDAAVPRRPAGGDRRPAAADRRVRAADGRAGAAWGLNGAMSVLILAQERDEHATAVAAELEKLGGEVDIVDTSQFPDRARVVARYETCEQCRERVFLLELERG